MKYPSGWWYFDGIEDKRLFLHLGDISSVYYEKVEESSLVCFNRSMNKFDLNTEIKSLVIPRELME